MKIVLAGLYYPFAILSYYKRALERRNDVELFCVGAHTGQWIPWAGGMDIPLKYLNSIDLPLPRDMLHPTWEFVESQLPWTPDCVITCDAGWSFTTKPKPKSVHIATDPHVLDYDKQRTLCDIFYNMQSSYLKVNDHLINYAFDPWCHYPIQKSYSDGGAGLDTMSDREYDCSIIGLHYPHRDEWVSRLRAKGIKVNYRIGDIYDEYREENNKAWIGLNWSSLEDVTARVFEICAMKLVPVLNRLPGLDKLGFEEGRHYLGFSTMDEAVEKVLWAKNNRPFAEQIALQAYNFVHQQDYTYDKNVKTILIDVGLL